MGCRVEATGEGALLLGGGADGRGRLCLSKKGDGGRVGRVDRRRGGVMMVGREACIARRSTNVSETFSRRAVGLG